MFYLGNSSVFCFEAQLVVHKADQIRGDLVVQVCDLSNSNLLFFPLRRVTRDSPRYLPSTALRG